LKTVYGCGEKTVYVLPVFLKVRIETKRPLNGSGDALKWTPPPGHTPNKFPVLYPNGY
jgi:hypothetical protein